MINIDDLTLGQIKEIIGMTKCTTDSTGTFLVIGKNYLIRTVTHYHVGRLIRIKKYASLLAGASWAADTQRFSTTLRSKSMRHF